MSFEGDEARDDEFGDTMMQGNGKGNCGFTPGGQEIDSDLWF